MLLVGDPASSWRDWLKENRGRSDLLILDPTDPTLGPPGRFKRFRDGRLIWERFYGSLDPLRAPHVLIGALAEALRNADNDIIVQAFTYRPNHLLRQTLLLVAQCLRPDSILVPYGLELDLNGFPVGPETVSLAEAFPKVVQQAQRKAHWMKMLEECQPQAVSLQNVTVEGTRLGSGRALTETEVQKLGVDDVLYVEKTGTTLLIVSASEVDEHRVSRVLDQTGCTKAIFADPKLYSDLLCSFARESGEDIGFGILHSLDFRTRTATCLCSAVPPAPVRILRLGSQRVDEAGNELGELRPSQI